jgi:hypothetical protein
MKAETIQTELRCKPERERSTNMNHIAKLTVALIALAAIAGPAVAQHRTTATLLASGLQGTIGSTIGPDGALYVPEGALGRISRVDPETGAVTTFASGLPPRLVPIPIGGAMDVAFLDGTAYVLVTLVDPSVGGSSVDGIYRVDSPTSSTIIADIGAFAVAHPPPPSIQITVESGVQYALQPYRGGFLVTDGHHNRVYFAQLNGQVSQVIQFDDIVPTGLTLRGNTVYLAEAGPIPHLPEDGLVVSLVPGETSVTTVASGAPLNVGVQFGPGHKLYALAQGHWSDTIPGTPADPNTGMLMKAEDGVFMPVVTGLDRPTSFQIIGHTAYVVTLTGQVWKIEHLR